MLRGTHILPVSTKRGQGVCCPRTTRSPYKSSPHKCTSATVTATVPRTHPLCQVRPSYPRSKSGCRFNRLFSVNRASLTDLQAPAVFTVAIPLRSHASGGSTLCRSRVRQGIRFNPGRPQRGPGAQPLVWWGALTSSTAIAQQTRNHSQDA